MEDIFAELRKQYIEEPSNELELSMVTHMRRRRLRRRMGVWSVTAATAAACILVIGVSAHRHKLAAPISVTKTGLQREATHVLLPSPALAANGAAADPGRPARVAGYHRREFRKQKPLIHSAEGGGFVAIPYAEPFAPSDQIDIYRVEIPRATLAHYGLPAQLGLSNAPITADVAAGSDGVIRAIRFVY
jgi:hypothetical protein